MTCTEAYKEHIEYTFNAFCRVVIHYAAAALSSLPEKKREIIYLYFFGRYTQQEIGELYGRCRSTAWHHIHSALQMLHEEMEVLFHEES
ncbi:MAG: hypothetical protein K2P44_04305 [Lachnospiraceae bacterium]|nr:hypothetical protein [Lachnospiraceae bacterium]